MYELNQVGTNSYYVQSPAKIGIVKLNDTEVCLIDSGSDKDAGRKVRQILDANGWKLTAIYNTHSNADHIGGNKYLQNQTGCKVYAVWRVPAKGLKAQIPDGPGKQCRTPYRGGSSEWYECDSSSRSFF